MKPGPLKRGGANRNRRSRKSGTSPGGADAGGRTGPDGAYWLYGLHAVEAALANPARTVRTAMATRNALQTLAARNLPDGTLERVEDAEPRALARLLPEDAVHQGVAAQVDPLPPVDLAVLERVGDPSGSSLAIVLDQVTDPRNVGAILRSAAAFGAAALIVQDRHSPPESGALAKAASGALDRVPIVRAGNLAQALRDLGELGYWRIGLAGESDALLDGALENAPAGPVALVLGAEGSGLRRLTRETCDALARLPTDTAFGTLNVSAAAAVALYAARSRAS